ncbi:MAG: hypothetical protein RL577_835 [Bacteroidota bacterium]
MRYWFFLFSFVASSASAQLLPNGQYLEGNSIYWASNDTLYWENQIPSYHIVARTTRDTSSLEGRVLIHDTYRITLKYLEGGRVSDLRYIQRALKNLYIDRYEFFVIEKDKAAQRMEMVSVSGEVPTAGYFLARAGKRATNSLLISAAAIPIALVTPALAAVIPALVVINQVGVYKDLKRAGVMLQEQGI